MTPPPTPQVAASPELPVLKPRARQSTALLPRCVVGALLFLCLLMPVGAALDVEVQITGVEDEQLANVRSFLSIEQQRTDPSLDEGRLRRYHQKAPGEVADALKGFGYYQVKTQSSLTQQDGKWTARYEVTRGLPVLISDVNLGLLGPGADDEAMKALVKDFPLHGGDVLDQRRYTSGKESFQRMANERGYFDFKFLTHALVIDPTANTAIVELGMTSGPRYDFGEINYHQDILRPDFLNRYAKFNPGDPYDINKLLDLQSALFDSDYFNNVEIEPKKEEAEDLRVPIDVRLTPRPRQRYTAGVGYGTDTGARSRLGWENRRINDRGHRFRADYQLSEIRQSLSTNYSWPIRNPRTDEIALTTSWVDDHPKVSQSEIFSVGLSDTIARSSGWVQTFYLKYQTENYAVGSDNGDALLLIPGMSWSRVSADKRTYPSRGWRFVFDLRGAHPALLSDREFVQLRGQAKMVSTLARHHRFILRGDVGNTRFESIRSLPTSVRFFTGGSQSVRGYDYNSLGPRDPQTDQVVGGSKLLVGSAEYEYRFTDTWSGATFIDVGNALNSWQEALKEGAGFGVRWISPVGPIRIDLAWAISEPGTPVQLHINVGPDL